MAQTMAEAAASASVRFIGVEKLLQITRAAVSISEPAAASFRPEIPTAGSARPAPYSAERDTAPKQYRKEPNRII